MCASHLHANIYMPKVRVTPIIGLPQFNGWSQVVESPPHSSVKTVLSVAIEGTQAGNVGRDIANYFSAQVIQTLEEFHLLLEEIIDQAIENEVRILCSAGYFSGENCAYATFNGAVLLKRNDKIGTILSSGNQLKLITGRVSLQDAVVFSTLPSASFFSEIELKFEQGYDIDTIVTSVVPGLHAEENSSLSSLAFVTFEEYSSKEAQMIDEARTRPQVMPEAPAPIPAHPKVSVEDSPSNREQVAPSVPPEPPQPPSQEPSQPQGSVASGVVSDDVADSLTASLDEPVVSEKKKSIDVVGLVSSLLSKGGSLFRMVYGFLVVIFQKVKPVFASIASGMKVGAGKLFTSLRSGSGSIDIKSMASDTAKAFKSMMPNSDVYIETSDSKKIKRIRVAVVVVSLLLIVGIGAVLMISKRNAEQEAAQAALAPFVGRVEAVQAQIESDPVAAREEVQAILREIENLQSEQDPNSLFYEIVATWSEEIEALYTDISGLDELQELPVFYDLRLVSSDFIASKLINQGDNLYFFDLEQKTLVTLNSTSKQASKYDISSADIRDAVVFEEDPLLLTSSGIGTLTLTDEESEYEEVIAEGDSNREASLLASFEPYVYVVNPEKRNIYRYAASDEGFSDPIGWIQDIARGLDFASVSSISIDGDVWLGTKAGEIFKFTRGSVQDFEIRGLDATFNSPVLVHTASETDRLYILEAQNNRIVVLQKNGDFIKEVSNTSLGSVTDIVVSDDGSTLYAISGSVVYRIDI